VSRARSPSRWREPPPADTSPDRMLGPRLLVQTARQPASTGGLADLRRRTECVHGKGDAHIGARSRPRDVLRPGFPGRAEGGSAAADAPPGQRDRRSLMEPPHTPLLLPDPQHERPDTPRDGISTVSLSAARRAGERSPRCQRAKGRHEDDRLGRGPQGLEHARRWDNCQTGGQPRPAWVDRGHARWWRQPRPNGRGASLDPPTAPPSGLPLRHHDRAPGRPASLATAMRDQVQARSTGVGSVTTFPSRAWSTFLERSLHPVGGRPPQGARRVRTPAREPRSRATANFGCPTTSPRTKFRKVGTGCGEHAPE